MDTLGVVELSSIAAGAELADGMVKVADVELVRAATLCSGRFIIYVAGDREAVETSVNFARAGQKRLTGSFVISHVSPLLTAALKKSEPALRGDCQRPAAFSSLKGASPSASSSLAGHRQAPRRVEDF